MEWNLERLRRASLAELEALYRRPDEPWVPEGWFHGHVLVRLDNPGARHPFNLAMQLALFHATPFGIDFENRRWFFHHRRLALGHFVATVGPSRWRDCPAVALTYEVTRLPGIIKQMLYDEVKPITDDLCLGLGGTNAERDLGDHFFFALTRARQ